MAPRCTITQQTQCSHPPGADWPFAKATTFSLKEAFLPRLAAVALVSQPQSRKLSLIIIRQPVFSSTGPSQTRPKHFSSLQQSAVIVGSVPAGDLNIIYAFMASEASTRPESPRAESAFAQLSDSSTDDDLQIPGSAIVDLLSSHVPDDQDSTKPKVATSSVASLFSGAVDSIHD